MSPINIEGHPYIILLSTEFVDYLSSVEFVSFCEKYKQSHLYKSHTLITYIFNIFSVFIKMAKNPHAVRKLKIENMINIQDVKIGTIMHSSLLQQLQMCSATSSLQNLFANPTSSFKLFCPSLIPKKNETTSELAEKKRPFKPVDKHQEFSNKKRDLGKGSMTNTNQGKGSIINSTGKKIWFPNGLEKKYCSNFLDVGESCPHGDKCHFVHAMFPKDFTENDKLTMQKHINNSQGLSCKNSGDNQVS